MSTQYDVFNSAEENNEFEIFLDERSGKLYLTVVIEQDGQTIEREKEVTVEDVAKASVALLGPAFYFVPTEEELVEIFKREMRERGFTRVKEWSNG